MEGDQSGTFPCGLKCIGLAHGEHCWLQFEDVRTSIRLAHASAGVVAAELYDSGGRRQPVCERPPCRIRMVIDGSELSQEDECAARGASVERSIQLLAAVPPGPTKAVAG